MKEQLRNYRRDFHKYPESGWTEFRTTSIVAEVLMGFNYIVLLGKDVIDESFVMGRPGEPEIQKHIQRAIRQGADEEIVNKMEGYTGVVAILDTGRPGPTTAFRFDIDANDVEESTSDSHRPITEGFRSLNPDVMHACGHDGHTAIGLGTAEYISKNIDQLKGKIILIFQPAEEGVRGARAIAEKGHLDKVDYFVAGHLGFNLDSGYFSPRASGFLATTKLDVTFKGNSAHAGAEPEAGKNALLAAAAAAINLHAISSHSKGATRLNVGQLIAGSGRNVIPELAVLKLETRGESTELNEYMLDKAYKVLNGAAAMYDVEIDVKKVGEAGTAECDDELVSIMTEIANSIPEFDTIVQDHKLGGSEDASVLMAKVQEHGGKATYVFLGSKIAAGHHNSKFDFDESVLERGYKIFTQAVKKLNGV